MEELASSRRIFYQTVWMAKKQILNLPLARIFLSEISDIYGCFLHFNKASYCGVVSCYFLVSSLMRLTVKILEIKKSPNKKVACIRFMQNWKRWGLQNKTIFLKQNKYRIETTYLWRFFATLKYL